MRLTVASRPDDDPRWLCVFEADLRVVDLRRAEVLDALEVTEADLAGDWTPDAPNAACLKVALAATLAGAQAIVVPSAARPGGWNSTCCRRASTDCGA